MQIDRQSVALMVRNTGSSPAVVRLAPLEDTCWQPQETEVPASPPDWLQVFPISCRIPPQVGPVMLGSLVLSDRRFVLHKDALFSRVGREVLYNAASVWLRCCCVSRASKLQLQI